MHNNFKANKARVVQNGIGECKITPLQGTAYFIVKNQQPVTSINFQTISRLMESVKEEEALD